MGCCSLSLPVNQAQVREYKKEVSGEVLTPAEKEDEEKIKAARGLARR